MALERMIYATLPNGDPVEQLTLSRAGGLTVSCITRGATLTALKVGGTDVILGYNSLEEYLQDTASLCVTVGRYANRIADGRFSLNGIDYDVGCNEVARQGHLHGGTVGFQAKNWEITQCEDNAFTLSLLSPDGDMGYPGTMRVSVRMALDTPNALSLTYHAVSDKDTVINLTNHTYFNLNGYNGGDILDTELQIHASAILPVNNRLIPTGEYLTVENTPFDFREPKPIGRDIQAPHEQLQLGGGYDHNFILDGYPAFRRAVCAHSPHTGIKMVCSTDQPGVQLYTGNFLNTTVGKGGAMHPRQGFCLETQHFPDSPHHPAFPSTVLRAHQEFHSTTVYEFL